MRKLSGCAVLLLSAYAALASAAGGSVYTWKDTSGHLHYSDNPPANTNVQVVQPGIQSGGPVADSDTASSATPAGTADSAAECQKQKDKLTAYTAASTISETDSLGKTREFSAEERQKLLALTTEKVKQVCGGS